MDVTPAIRTSILRIVGEAFPSLVYGHPVTYIVAAVRADKRLDLVPPTDAQHLSELSGVEQWGLGLVEPPVGTEVVVEFRDANPSRPMVRGFAHGTQHESVVVSETDDAVVPDPTGRFVRYGDPIVFSTPGPGVISAPAPGPASRVKG